MSEFPEWVERDVIGFRELSYEEAQEIHRKLQTGELKPPSVCRRSELGRFMLMLRDSDDVTMMKRRRPAGEAAWANRIVGEGYEAPDQLLAAPDNWRIHPREQQEALEGVLDRVGWVTRIIVNKRTGHVIDGHLRVSLAISRGEPTVPVTYVDLSDREEGLVLATLDP